MATLTIKIAKAGSTRDIDPDSFPDNVYAEALRLGFEALANKGMSKVGAVTKLEGAEKDKAIANANEIADNNLAELAAGNIKAGRAAAKSKVPGVVLTEARRLAKEVVKDAIRREGKKISHFEPKQITLLANQLIEADPSYIESAKANIEARTSLKPTISLAGLEESPKLVAAAEAEKAKRKEQLSAKQAGKVAAPRKPKSGTPLHV